MVQNPVKFGCGNECQKIEKIASFHNAKLRFFLLKNTISCGLFSLPTKPVVGSKFHHFIDAVRFQASFSGFIQDLMSRT